MKTKLLNKENKLRVIEILHEEYLTAVCGLNFKSPLELTIALILAAQCTDKRVNQVIPELFNKYKTIEAFADADINELEKDIRTCGFYRNKANNIKKTCKKIITDFDSQVPTSMDKLTTLFRYRSKIQQYITTRMLWYINRYSRRYTLS